MQVCCIGLIAHTRVEDKLARKIADKLSQAGAEVFLDPATARKFRVDGTEVGDMRIDLAVVVGGDGTILWAINELRGDPLILGVNVGNVGYLAELTPETVMGKLDLLLKGEGGYWIDERMKLIVDDEFEVLNEVLITSREPAALLGFRVKLDNEEIAHFRADGVVVSTPTGSTAYSLSAGGSILHPKVRGYIITPVNPFQRGQHPIVVPEGSETTIELVRGDREAKLILDGRMVKEITSNHKTSIKKSQHTARFVRFSGDAK